MLKSKALLILAAVVFIGAFSALIGPEARAGVIFVSGDVSGTWSADTVIVTDSIYVSSGNTLVIEPGIDVLFTFAYSFRIYSGATLQAIGTEDEMIRFLPFTSGFNTLGIEFVDASDESILEYCYFNHALYSAIKLTNSPITIRNCTMEGNPGYSSGGAIAVLQGSDALIEDNTIRDNNGGYEGGAIYCDASSPTIRGNIIDGNSTYGLGGGIACENYSAPMIIGNTLSNNVVTPSIFPPGPAQGGAIYCSNGSLPVIIGNLFFNNRVNAGGESAYNGGGAIFVFSSTPVIMNNVFAQNTAPGDDGGALFLFICNSHLVNNTFIYNTAGDRGGAVYFALSSYPEVTNCIMRNNSAPNGPMIYLTDSDLTVAYSDIEGGWEGVGNIDVNPMFRDPAGGDYHLQDSVECGDQYYSPCIDAGSPDFTDSLLDCSWGLGSELCDMGAYGGGDSVSVGISQQELLIPQAFALSQNFPNPFNARTTIKYALPYSCLVNLDILDALGRKVTTLVNGNQPAGYHQVTWDATDRSSGMYFYKIQAGGISESGKMLLLK